jgi:hypothetical protein
VDETSEQSAANSGERRSREKQRRRRKGTFLRTRAQIQKIQGPR